MAAEEAASLDSALRSVLRKSARPGREDADRPNQKMSAERKKKAAVSKAKYSLVVFARKVKKTDLTPYAPLVLTLARQRRPNNLKVNGNPARVPVFSSNTRTGD